MYYQAAIPNQDVARQLFGKPFPGHSTCYLETESEVLRNATDVTVAGVAALGVILAVGPRNGTVFAGAVVTLPFASIASMIFLGPGNENVEQRLGILLQGAPDAAEEPAAEEPVPAAPRKKGAAARV